MRDQTFLLALIVFALLALCFGIAWQRERRRFDVLETTIEQRVADAVEHSRRTSSGSRLGRLAEQMVPFFPQFPYDPQDARFLGGPIDFVVFDGLCNSEVTQVVLVEVKSGKKKGLSPRQRRIQECVEAGRVRFETILV